MPETNFYPSEWDNHISRDDVPGVREAYVSDALNAKDPQIVITVAALTNRVLAEEA